MKYLPLIVTILLLTPACKRNCDDAIFAPVTTATVPEVASVNVEFPIKMDIRLKDACGKLGAIQVERYGEKVFISPYGYYDECDCKLIDSLPKQATLNYKLDSAGAYYLSFFTGDTTAPILDSILIQ